MTDGVIVVASWVVRPERAEETVALLRSMFPVTRTKQGFRSIKLLRSDGDTNLVALMEEWDTAQDFHNYIQFRTDDGSMAILTEMSDGSPMQLGLWNNAPLAEAQA